MFHKLSLILILFLTTVPLSLWADDIEPSKSDISISYTLEDIQGAGSVQVLIEGQTDWTNAIEGQTLEEGDQIKVGPNTEAVLSLNAETLVHLSQSSQVSISQLQTNDSKGFLTHLMLLAGRVLSDVKKNLNATQSSFEIESGGVVCGVRGTVFEVEKSGDDVQATTHEGTVETKTSDGVHQVTPGQTCQCHQGAFRGLGPCGKRALARLAHWKKMRARILAKCAKRAAQTKNGPIGIRSHGRR